MMAAKSDLDRQIADLLADPAYEGHPLRVALEALWKQANEHMVRIERVTQISDAYQSMALQREQGLYERFDRQLQRLARIARISDHYQSMMRDLNHTLEETSRRDPLTGLFNRRALMDIIRTAVERSDASGRTFVIAMLDVDHFKSVNDRFGHETGDRVLVELAGVLQQSMRDSDHCGRWGGEEFLLLLPDTDLAAAQLAMDRVVGAVRALSIGVSGDVLRLTVSIGMADHQMGESLSETLSRADQALYLAKHDGRDRVALTGAAR
ncbi:diguanylate cyclase domain protein [Bordetella holmesii 30539]|uniref:diguanylate cyclase n=3 Tax=Bordetella holmesii TaxID=35814 RepID=A0A158M058_9BORD|nr:diguanylate cyclase domain protein [Bordetella holmesii ATCC 51541]AMD48987.1 diguanylate cyclase [Bordetella holmesii F627]EXF88603.1 diguanylate cyclase domain protein [Bordetella holmesii 30539]EXX96426.1 diguanylate cyclase domain protein [Bordetella holmesii 1058]KAK87173.1 diguanylate cyclase (GGDEF) domain protein [Bordetella holmesii CDC-H585-BH]KAK88126.1 diguanylate cyclase (GGDEF) domain protein [Bordetella holmesii CDC-H572-BH]KAL02185.1 diguanylate cyclase (GGDEF) domain prote